jgi:hypothetical protein
VQTEGLSHKHFASNIIRERGLLYVELASKHVYHGSKYRLHLQIVW